MDYRQLLRALAAGRIAVGAAALVAPRVAGRRWIGEAGARRDVAVMARAFGVRDLALGVGTLQALDQSDRARPWATLGLVCDLADLVATGLAIRALGPKRALPVMAVAGGAAALGYLARDQVD